MIYLWLDTIFDLGEGYLYFNLCRLFSNYAEHEYPLGLDAQFDMLILG